MHIFQSGHTLVSIIGGIISIYALWHLCYNIPYMYDTYIVNKPIDPRTFDENASRKREKSIRNLVNYYRYVARNTSYREPLLNDFGKKTYLIGVVSVLLLLCGIFLPAVLKGLWWLLSHTL